MYSSAEPRVRPELKPKVSDEADLLLHRRFERQALRTPNSVALRAGAVSISYRELNERADRVAAFLRARGVGDAGYVGLHIDRSIDYVAAMLAVLKANCAAVPLPPSYPQARLHEILSFARLDAVIDTAATPLPHSLDQRVLRFSEAVESHAEPSDRRPSSPRQPAFVLCSSGSTGKPKMIVRSHRSFFHRLNWTWTAHPYESGEACCQKSHMTTTHAIYELFEPLLCGVPTLIVPDQEVRDLEGFWDTLRSNDISRLLIVPSLLQASLDMPGFVPPPFKVLVLMGEHVPPRLAGRVREVFGAATKVFSIYGSTEASSTLVCDVRESFRLDAELPLGQPISPDVHAHVLDANRRPVAAGDTGLLHISGPALFEGYFRDPELTRSVFFEPPEGLGTLYNTNDQVRLLSDGGIQYVGRVDHTVKVRGYRVDLQEVERTILLHPQVTQAAVLPVSDGTQDSALVAFFAPATVDRADLQGFVGARLPAYMIPSMLVSREVFPRTPGGKTDRKRLLQEHMHSQAAASPAGIASDTLAEVFAAFSDVLKHRQFGAQTSFFEAGGTSLTVFSLVRRLRSAFSLDRSQLTERSVYEYPTTESLASYIDSLKAGNTPARRAGNAILATLKTADSAELPPLFAIASAGGTLGAYGKLAKALQTKREVVGIRDPFIWGGREPTAGFNHWVDLYIAAIHERQPLGPYHLLAYSSAGAFGYEIARRLQRDGQKIGLLALVDPIGIDSRIEGRFGYWAGRALFQRPIYKHVVRAGGRLLAVLPRFVRGERDDTIDDALVLTADEFQRRAEACKANKHFVSGLAALLELNTGLPFTLPQEELEKATPAQYLPLLLARAQQVAPDIDPAAIENILVQYNCLQAPAQQCYRLRRFDGAVLLFQLDDLNHGLLPALFRPYVKRLRVVSLPVGRPSGRALEASEHLPEGLRSHYYSMRDDRFVGRLSQEIDTALGE